MSLTDALLLDPHPFDSFIACRKDGLRGCGKVSDPWDASTPERFDRVLRDQVQPCTRVHLGPGKFRTNGFSPGAPVGVGWQAKPKVSIVGAGIEATKIVLELHPSHGAQVFVVGHDLVRGLGLGANPVDFFELSDLTLECPFSMAHACSGIRVMGHHVLIQRVRVQGWSGDCGASLANPGYGIMLITGLAATGDNEAFASHNAGVSRCIVTKPTCLGSGPESHSTAIYVGATPESNRVRSFGGIDESYGVAPYVRHCYIDGSMPGPAGIPDSPPIRGSGRGLAINSCRGAIIEGNQIHHVQHAGPVVETASVRDLVIRQNFYHNVERAPQIIGNDGVSITPATLSGLEQLPDEGGTIAQALTGGPHDLKAGERVRIARVAGSPGTVAAEYLGTFEVREIRPDDSSRFRYKMIKAPAQGTAQNVTWQKVFGAGLILIEGNTIELATGVLENVVAIEISDSLMDSVTTMNDPDQIHGDVIIRRNWIRYADLLAGLGYSGTAIKAAGVKNLTVSENVIECDPEHPMRDYRCQHATYFNNKTPQGTLIRGFSPNGSFLASELATDAEDAMVLALL